MIQYVLGGGGGRGETHLWKVPGEALSEVLEQQVAVVLGVGIVGELSLCHHLSATHHLQHQRLRYVVLCKHTQGTRVKLYSSCDEKPHQNNSVSVSAEL